MLDLLIRGGEVVDGTGAARRRADVGILDGKIVTIGKVDEPSRRTIDADGRIVAPGFIDVHTHYDVQAFWDPHLTPSPLHGVTTVLGGNCGFTVAPLSAESADYMMRTLAKVEGMPLSTLETAVMWDWTTTGEYLDRLDGTLALNAGFMVGHTAIRRLVMGEDATTRACTPPEFARMAALLREGLAAGGLGFSTSRGRSHQDANGDSVPSRHASVEEMIGLAAVCGEFPGTSLEFIPHHKPFSDEDQVIALGMTAAAGRPLNWNLIDANAATVDTDLGNLDLSGAAAERGGKVVALTMPLDIIARYSFGTAFGLDGIPGWEKDMAKPLPDRLVLLADKAERDRLNALSRQGEHVREIANWGDKIILETHSPDLKRYEGRTVADIAAEERKEPFDALLDIACADGLRTTFCRPRKNSPMDWEARARIWRDQRTVIGASDAGAHVDLIDTFVYPTTLLASAVREHEIFSLEEAVEQITSRPADLYGLRGRGRLMLGAHADIVIFDEGTVAPGPTEIRADLPAGAERLYAEAVGVDEVIVNGVTILANGEFTEARPGTLFRSGRDTATPSLD